MLKKDHIVGIILVAMGFIACILSMQVKVVGSSTDPGSRVFPLAASILLIICGAGVILTGNKGEAKVYLSKDGWKRLSICFGVMVIYTIALKYLGFLVSTPFFLYAITTILADGKKLSIWKKIVYSILITAFSWLIFHNGLSMSMPMGKLF